MKKLNGFSNFKKLNVEEQKNFKGGHEWTYVCSNGEKGLALDDADASITYAEIMCGDGNIAYLYHFEH
jgi:hypothetical protein